MSYIRALSNPEHLYVLSTGGDTISWYGKKCFDFNETDFFSFIKHLNDNAHDYGKHGDFELKEVKYKCRISAKTKAFRATLKFEMPPISDHKDCLYYKGELVSAMWHVTWIYIKNNITRSICKSPS